MAAAAAADRARGTKEVNGIAAALGRDRFRDPRVIVIRSRSRSRSRARELSNLDPINTSLSSMRFIYNFSDN